LSDDRFDGIFITTIYGERYDPLLEMMQGDGSLTQNSNNLDYIPSTASILPHYCISAWL
jgi:hypothetical protein